MRKPVLAGNWKMYKTILETKDFLRQFHEHTISDDREVVICAPYPALPWLTEACEGTSIQIGAQNVHWELEGAFTGEVSVQMLKALHVTHVIIGHSERRAYFAETDEMIGRKLRTALTAGLTPILCIGETLEEKELGKTNEVVKRQLRTALEDVSPVEVGKLIIAYEPVWAIGSGLAATDEDAENVISYIRSLLPERYQDKVRILYGGSVKPENIAAYMSQPNIDGALVGGASLDPDVFHKMLVEV
ncbi:triose-phosphate isomerase [Shimazuella alba]|uniref:Triosephosphate isomerase n=1 Tax=Shimazuella alba TaxID=2690964 RepID=A0A6I4W098_9BACL|nr:triose-phosphate isomerase [Shimazuella alba]MXQ55660.1 triose-phosphate isomerase [Shimazuella alba]